MKNFKHSINRGIYQLISGAFQDHKNLPVLITEEGCCFKTCDCPKVYINLLKAITP